jgi:hypothetical protein
LARYRAASAVSMPLYRHLEKNASYFEKLLYGSIENIRASE